MIGSFFDAYEMQMVRLICQFQEGGFKHTNLEQLYRALERLCEDRRPKRAGDNRKPLRSQALLTLDINKLIAEYQSGTAPYTLAIRFGIDRETVAKRLRDAGVFTLSTNPARISKT
jgi:hypothetical protein